MEQTFPLYPLVNKQFAIDNGHLQWIYPLKMVIFQFAILVYQRVTTQLNYPPYRNPWGLTHIFLGVARLLQPDQIIVFFLTMVTFHSYVSLLEGNSHNIILSYYHYYCYYYRKIIYKWNIFQQARMPKASRRTDFGRWGPVWLVHFRVLRCQMKQLIFANSRVLEKSRFQMLATLLRWGR